MYNILTFIQGTDVDTTCTEYENGTSLHIAAANLSVEAAGILLSFGADKDLQDDLARMPIDCIPELEDFDLIPDAAEIIVKMKKLLSNSQSIEDEPSAKQEFYTGNSKAISGRTALKALGLKVGDRVVVNGSKLGTLRFCGSTDFAPGVWAGIEYEEEDGKNDGSVKGVMYFKCKMNHGVFVMANKVTKVLINCSTNMYQWG
jgi:CAP-Gly domain-containing linker protein 3/4